MANSVNKAVADRVAQFNAARVENASKRVPAILNTAPKMTERPTPAQIAAMQPAPRAVQGVPAPTIPAAQQTAPSRGMGATGGKPAPAMPMKKAGGKVSSASKRADGIAQRGKTKGRLV